MHRFREITSIALPGRTAVALGFWPDATRLVTVERLLTLPSTDPSSTNAPAFLVLRQWPQGQVLAQTTIPDATLGLNTGLLLDSSRQRLFVLSPHSGQGELGWVWDLDNTAPRPLKAPTGFRSFIEVAWWDNNELLIRNGEGEVWALTDRGQWIQSRSAASATPFRVEPIHVWRWRLDGRGFFGLWRNNEGYHLQFMDHQNATISVPWEDSAPTPANASFLDMLGDDSINSPIDLLPERCATDLAVLGRSLAVCAPGEIREQYGRLKQRALVASPGGAFTHIDSAIQQNGETALVLAEEFSARHSTTLRFVTAVPTA